MFDIRMFANVHLFNNFRIIMFYVQYSASNVRKLIANCSQMVNIHFAKYIGAHTALQWIILNQVKQSNILILTWMFYFKHYPSFPSLYHLIVFIGTPKNRFVDAQYDFQKRIIV